VEPPLIAKQVALRFARKGDFADLVRYITDAQGKAQRVGRVVVVTNCTSHNPLDAAIEVRLTQQLNTRSAADKTYHLIVSFRVGEHPSAEVLQAIEQRLCEGLGFGDHQRVSASHHDTDNLHVRIAINKVHPTRHTVHAPYYDHTTLGKLCEELETSYGLQTDIYVVFPTKAHLSAKTRVLVDFLHVRFETYRSDKNGEVVHW
jgi:hypothetical protein